MAKQVIKTEKAPVPLAPYSQGIIAKDEKLKIYYNFTYVVNYYLKHCNKKTEHDESFTGINYQ